MMPRIVRTLWFEDLGLLHEPFLDTPFGKLTVRQMLIVLSFGSLAFISISMTEDLMLKFVIGGTVIVAGLILALQRVKTIPPERSLILMLSTPKPPSRKREKKLIAEPLESKQMDMLVEDVEGTSPVKVVGVLKDPRTGKPLSNKGFTVYVDGSEYAKGLSDEEGFFTIYFLPLSYGTFTIELKPEGYAEASEKVLINVQPKAKRK